VECPNCHRKLFKGDVVVVREFVFDWKFCQFELEEKKALCPYCGFVLGSRSSRHPVVREEVKEV